jgi:MarR family transcriptional regulator, negative regulator of the multidrug operon emrRAB
MDRDGRLENILGSAAVAVADAIDDAAELAAGHGAAGPAALTALRHHQGCSVDHLAGVIGLSHSGTVRLVDRLEADGLVRRGPGRDARAVALDLTAKGARRAESVAGARAAATAAFLATLDAEEQTALLGLLEKLVTAGMADWRAVTHRCRLCDLEACHADGGRCPLDVHMAELAG